MKEDSERGLYEKYSIEHTDGRPIDPNAQYLVIRYDRPEDSINRELVRMFALTCGNEKLKGDLLVDLKVIESSELCPYCKGAGEVHIVSAAECTKCSGRGVVVTAYPAMTDNGINDPCDKCEGTGKKIKAYRCGNCGGRGRILSDDPKKAKWMCPKCLGTGGKMNTESGKIDTCSRCNGDGWVLE